MSSLLQCDVARRRDVASGELLPLASALRAELQPLIAGRLVIPDGKARLTRIGGRCELDGTMLDFDPYAPHEHRCRQCGRSYSGQAHHDWWAMGAQLWTAERAVQGAALYLLRNDQAVGAVSLRILRELGERYSSWENKDNALGPTRPFFSTYLESIWLLNLCHAISLLETAGVSSEAERVLSNVRDRLVMPSRDLIASFHEGQSNRQVWNEVAILSASQLLGDHRTIDNRLSAKNGLHGLVATGLLDDGTWYEGENYHLFAHRGLWYGVQLLRALGRPLTESLDARYRAGFVTPFLGLLPDDTIPSRRDSQYKVSIRQWRFAEWCELGIAHASTLEGHPARPDSRLAGTLRRLYASDAEGQLVHQARHRFSTADSERNEPPGLLSRSDLSWRALLMADAELQAASTWSPASVCLPGQGLAVIRREQGAVYVALEGGHTGGGHGHRDRLALTLQHGRNRWLEDPGTGSYVERKLHWYRSSLAHAAPVIDGASQDAVPAELLAFEDRGWAGWIKKRVVNMKPGVNVERTVVVCEGYLIDLLEWNADREVQVDLPVARGASELTPTEFKAAGPGGAGGLEDGFDFLMDTQVGRGESAHPEGQMSREDNSKNTRFTFRHDSIPAAMAEYKSSHAIEVWRATAPGSPGCDTTALHWLRTRAQRGHFIGIWTWANADACTVLWNSKDPEQTSIAVTMADGVTATHSPSESGWHIDLRAGNATSSIDLESLQLADPTAVTGEAPHVEIMAATQQRKFDQQIPHAPDALRFELGEHTYLRTEQTWVEAGKPRATIQCRVDGDHLCIDVVAFTGPPVVPPLDADNELDNERRDVNADGVQLHVAAKSGQPWTAAWIAVPSSECLPTARVTPLVAHATEIESRWSLTAEGWSMTLRVPLTAIPFEPDGSFAMEIIVNERPPNRARRRGQLVLSGGTGFAYLRGDRTESTHALMFRLNNR
ncbi:MAG: heparinase II/III family protein [Phycisphaerae bacterium]|nr:heparinase II/III family protein [Gemmatimonadaceae bacterium]